MNYEQWLAAAKAHAGDDWEYFNEWFSFETAFNEGSGPLEAVVDCAAWLED